MVDEPIEPRVVLELGIAAARNALSLAEEASLLAFALRVKTEYERG